MNPDLEPSWRSGTLAAVYVVVAGAGAVALGEWLAIRYLLQRVAQEYGSTDLLLAFFGTSLIWGCLHAAVSSWKTGRVTRKHGVVLLAVVGLSVYYFWPSEEYGFFSYDVGPPPSLTRDVLLLAAAIGGGLALPAAAPRLLARRQVGRIDT